MLGDRQRGHHRLAHADHIVDPLDDGLYRLDKNEEPFREIVQAGQRALQVIQTGPQAFHRCIQGRKRTAQLFHRFAQGVEDVLDLPHRFVGVQRGLGEGLDPASLGAAAHRSVCHDRHYAG